MLPNLTLGEKLKDLRLAKGYKNTEDLANAVGIPKTTLNDYENDEKNQDVGYYNLVILAKFYDVSMDWLLGLSGTEKHLNTPFMDLGLTDKTLDILQAKVVNTRLLSEMIEHEQFSKFMADMEIYIDGLASIQINNLNSLVATTRNIIKEQHNPDKTDLHLKTLEAGQIKEERYFHSIIHEDIDIIVDGLRKLHMENKKDTLVASENIEVVEILMNSIKKASTIDGTLQEKQISLFLGLLGVDKKKLNKNDLNALSTIIRKSNYAWKKK